MIAYRYPPIKSMAAFRNYGLSIEFQKYFDKVEVISTSNHHFLPKEYFPVNGIKILHSPTLDYRTFFHSQSSSGVSKSGSRIKQLFRKIKNSFPFNIILDLGGIFYIIFAVIIGIFRIYKSKITHLSSSYPVFSDLIIAFILKSIFPSIYWVADFHNLHISPDNDGVVLPNFQNRVERFLVSKANIISTVSEGLIPHLKLLNQNIFVVELGIIQVPFELKENKSNKFTITYTGSLYPKQTIAPLLQVISQLIAEKRIQKDKICLQYSGVNNDSWNRQIRAYNFDSINKDLGTLKRKDAVQLQFNSHINLLLSWTTPHLKTIIPGKFYEYLVVKRPILLIINGGKDEEWEKRIKDLNAGLVIYNSNNLEKKLSLFILDLYNRWIENNQYPFQEMQTEVLESYYLEFQVERFVKNIL